MGKVKKYYQVTRSSDPSITGLIAHYAMPQVEILPPPNTYSYISESAGNYINDLINKTGIDEISVYMDSFTIIELPKVSILNAVKTNERVKEVDFMLPKNHIKDFNYIFSEELMDVIEKYRLPEYNKIKVQIEGFRTEYYLIGFPMISPERLDFKKSVFVDCSRKNRKKVFKTYGEYENYDSYLEGLLVYKKIVLSDKVESDVLELPGAIYFSEDLANEIENANFRAIEIHKENTLEC